jgi:hypothetical protein
MRIQYDLRFRDIVLFQAVHQFLSPVLQTLYLLAPLFAYHAEASDGATAEGAIAFALTLYVVMWLVQFAFNALYLISRKNGNILTAHSIELRSDGIAEETQFTQTFVQWPGIAKVVSRPGFVAIYISSQQAHVIPNRAFPSAPLRAEFLATARQKVRASQP